MPQPGPQIIRITDPDDPRLADYANLKDRQLAAMTGATHDAPPGGLFMAEGELVVRQLLLSGLGIKSVLITETRLGTMRDVIDPLHPNLPVYVTDQAMMTGSVGFHIHRGILAAGIRPPARTPDSILSTARTVVILEDLTNHDNVGGVFRTAAALGGLESTGVLLSPRCCDPLYRKAIRVSMGMALRLPFATLSPWPDALDTLRRSGFTTVALTPGPDAIPLATAPIPDRLALILGTEGRGLSREALERADVRVAIPMGAGVDSLNVVVAAGIALHHFRAGIPPVPGVPLNPVERPSRPDE